MSYRLKLTSAQVNIALQIAYALTANAGIPVADGHNALSFQKLEQHLTDAGDRIPSSAAVATAIASAVALTKAYSIKGSVDTVEKLPTAAEFGDIYLISATGQGFAWNGQTWVFCGNLMFSGVSSINGVSPDSSGAVYLTAENVPMLSGESIAEAIALKQTQLSAGDGILLQDGLISAVSLPCNYNLLDNSNFGNPVNQRGASGTVTSPGYFFDRWKLESGSVTIGSGFIVLDGTISQPFAYNPQYPYSAPTVATVLTDNGIDDVVPEYTIEDSKRKFKITATGQKLYCAKLEIGHEQTLAHLSAGKWYPNEVRKYVEELMQCKRFLTVFDNSSCGITGVGYRIDSNTIWGYFPVQFKMYGSPTLSDTTGSNWAIRGGGKYYTPTKVQYVSKRDNAIVLGFTVSDAVENTAFVISCVSKTKILLSCEP